MTMDLALVGIGKIARDQHIPALSRSPDFRLAAVASRNAELGGVASFRSLAELLEARPDIPAVSLATPPQVRFDDARRAILAGRHVMLEKPPGKTLSEVEELARLARARGVTLFATWHSRHAAAVGPARDWLAGREIRAVDIAWLEDVRQWHPGQEWIWQPGGLGVFDPGINALSVLSAILPDPVHLAEAELEFPENRATPIAARLVFSHPAGIPVTARFDWREAGPPRWQIVIDTDQGRAVLDRGGAVLRLGPRVLAEGPDSEYPALYARFAALIARSESEVDLSPMRHVADAFLIGRHVATARFDW
ncbi:D-galactose 1-dehydrogenase/L-arabinose 1-dehydrogenase [Meinhardsimonia xiamenensis]|jgi:predicted dehydrogenase|uniref:D-galactose 1-dehydrogenase/L-arabinose 1-dehydrogenase n=1 Tax=Meinhardsimonia xiamenensis TaxID=990712 RepID=A0A1G9FIM8_9RHOB|nr:Gfo/Idh/MocA family oxidoreductase [Meinhardsimonia xiamenensis]PRX37827.1 galactose 1-dehydrogenase [Meinhardsimonia xiamenensis]SDK88239.1 D-galactose 1-dehydrogenase/L-arabinose 1-dehydrogenase [Meinhardsimonia xiamenensis]